ncbi:MAG: hypothetical protein QXY61_01775 [Candidatus Anstonellales archaeon]
MIENRFVTIACLIVAVASLLYTIASGNIFAALIAVVFAFLTLLMWKYGYLVMPYFFEKTKIVEIRYGYEIPPSRDYLIRKTPSGYLATKFLGIKLHESTLDKGEKERASLLASFERAISSLNNVVKISYLLAPLDITKHVEEIKTQRSMAEVKRAKLGAKEKEEAVILDRQIAMWNRLLERISGGEKPLETIIFASTTASGATREEAVAKVKRQAKEIRTILSSTLGADVVELMDSDMLRCFEWEFFAPPTPEALKDEVF